MAVKNATTRKRIATVKLTELEIRVLRQSLQDAREAQRTLGIDDAAKSASQKLLEAEALFTRYT